MPKRQNQSKKKVCNSGKKRLSCKTLIIDLRTPKKNSESEKNIFEINEDVGWIDKVISHQNQTMKQDNIISNNTMSKDESKLDLQPKRLDFNYNTFTHCNYFKCLSYIWNEHEYLSDFNDNINNKREGKIAKIPLTKLYL